MSNEVIEQEVIEENKKETKKFFDYCFTFVKKVINLGIWFFIMPFVLFYPVLWIANKIFSYGFNLSSFKKYAIGIHHFASSIFFAKIEDVDKIALVFVKPLIDIFFKKNMDSNTLFVDYYETSKNGLELQLKPRAIDETIGNFRFFSIFSAFLIGFMYLILAILLIPIVEGLVLAVVAVYSGILASSGFIVALPFMALGWAIKVTLYVILGHTVILCATFFGTYIKRAITLDGIQNYIVLQVLPIYKVLAKIDEEHVNMAIVALEETFSGVTKSRDITMLKQLEGNKDEIFGDKFKR